MSTRIKVLLGIVIWIGGAVILGVGLGGSGKNETFQPQEEFRLVPWVSIHVGPLDLSINKGVLYLVLACVLTGVAMTWIARRMTEREPNRVQTAVEVLYDLTYNNISRGNMPPEMSVRWFPFVGTLFFFIWISNLLGYVPLPTNINEPVGVFGVEVPSLAIYAATANLSVPLVLTLVVWVSYQFEGIRAKGAVAYFKGWIPKGSPKPLLVLIVPIEILSQFMRIVSLSVRLFANILAGHLLILFMGGGLAVLLGLAALGWLTGPIAIVFFIFEIGLVATLQAFIFATLSSIYFGEAVAEGH